ncbi:hypothetical protein MVEG_08685 [Podila verticillata NRRL 6337]|nr:hypothetical protein MVEG_08685 [Podila verticillata NRRL 6337]
MIDGSEPEVSPVWACQKLQALHLGLALKGAKPDSEKRGGRQINVDRVSQPDGGIVHASAGTTEVSLGFGFCFNSNAYHDTLPFLALSFECAIGLRHLAGLSGRKALSVSGHWHDIRCK